MDECEGDFEEVAHPTDRCRECSGYLRDHYWYSGLFVRN
jgi:hypothetical protein